jgi:ferric-dicitrate binding protein FerR (iron transport regulator)
MAEKFEQIAHAILNTLREQASEAEQGQLQQWLNASEENRRLMNEFEDPVKVGLQLAEFQCENLAEHRQRVWRRIEAMAQQEIPGKERSYSKISRRLVWAALFVGLVAGVWYLLSKQAAKHTIMVTNSSGNGIVNPTSGTDTAKILLRLADGKEYEIQKVKDGPVSSKYGIYKAGGKIIVEQGTAHPKNTSAGYQELIVPQGGSYQLQLPDGTNAWINSKSSILFPEADTGRIRSVRISGEVYFEVTKNNSRPFMVALPNGDLVEVLGTTFDVNAYPDEHLVRTTLIKGVVTLKRRGKSIPIKPGQQAQVTGDETHVIDKVNITKILSWVNGGFSFRDDSLTTVLRELSRWYNMEVYYVSTPPRVTVSLIDSRRKPVDDILTTLNANTGVHIVRDKNRLKVYP